MIQKNRKDPYEFLHQCNATQTPTIYKYSHYGNIKKITKNLTNSNIIVQTSQEENQ